MAIVDLRGREHEPEVRALLESEPTWTMVGSRRDDRLVARVGIERTSDDELTMRRSARVMSLMHARSWRRSPGSRPAYASSWTWRSRRPTSIGAAAPMRFATLRARVRPRLELD
jgi:hypothetical protein